MSIGVETFDDKEISLCTPCIQGKQHKEKFPKEGVHQATKLLGFIHSNICGPLQTRTHLRCTIFITFIDDFSTYCFVYLMKHKYETLDKNLHYKNFVKKQINHQIKILRSDRGGEGAIILTCIINNHNTNHQIKILRSNYGGEGCNHSNMYQI
jgi:hypothetical protein